MVDAILILNAGSSSIKFSVFAAAEPGEAMLRGQIERLNGTPKFRAVDAQGRAAGEHEWGAGESLTHAGAVDWLLSWGAKEGLRGHRIIAAGHRVVHGGLKFDRPVRIDAGVLAELERLVPLAPLHQPHALAAIAAVSQRDPALPQVACFDTAFHRTQPEIAQAFALPRAISERGVRRYGFHGLSYEYIARSLPGIDPAGAKGRTIVAHLGAGASLCAMIAGRSIATTMGFTALDGLVMGTRCGAIDPGVLLYLAEHDRMSPRDMQHMLYDESGLLGVSGISGDMRTLLESKDQAAREAVDLFVYRASLEIGSMAAALGGLSTIVFTGGIGENSAVIRRRICEASRWLGVEIDEAANARGDTRIGRAGGRVSVCVIPTNEELMIVRHTLDVLGTSVGGRAGNDRRGGAESRRS